MLKVQILKNLLLKNSRLLSAVAFVIVLSSCQREIQFEKNEYLLYRQQFEGNVAIADETLEAIIPISQKPNNRPLFLPFTPRVWWMNIGKNTFDSTDQLIRKKILTNRFDLLATDDFSLKTIRRRQKLERKIDRIDKNLTEESAWFWRTIGENPSVISVEGIQASAFKLKKFLFDSGFRDAEVTFGIDTVNNEQKKIRLTYFIKENEPYIIDSVAYEIPDTTLARAVVNQRSRRVVKKGLRFDQQFAEAEQKRIELDAKNSGYYNFSNQYILFGATNESGSLQQFKADKKGTLKFQVFNPDDELKHQKFTVTKVSFRAVELTALTLQSRSDTVYINEVSYISNDLKIPLQVIDQRIKTRPGDLYSINALAETQRQIGLLNQFAFVSQQVTPLTDSTLRIDYFAPTLNRYGFTASPGVQNLYNSGNSNFTGFIIPFSLSIRNSLQRLETLEISASGGVEGQPSPIDVSKIRGSIELGVNASVTFPNFILPFVNSSRLNTRNSKTVIGGGFNYSEPFWGQRLNFNFRTNYSWQPSIFKQVTFSLLDLNLINTIYTVGTGQESGNSFYNELVRQQALGNNLKVTFDPQFVSSINASFVYNNQNIQERYGNATYLRVFAESGGTTLNFLANKNQIGFIENLFPLNQSANSPDSVRAYFQFLKINVDYRKYRRITNKSGWAYRFNIGVINPYGANKSVPYNKNFFAGGSNSVRAWSPLSLGVGSAQPDITADGNVIPQPGDILLETSVEYRKTVGNFFGDIQLATFIDAGNIWKWNQVPTKINQANFDINRFYKEFAVGTGFGIRYDFTYFLLRFDWGIKVIDPSRPVGDRFVLDEFSLRRNKPYGLQLQFGVGYPF